MVSAALYEKRFGPYFAAPVIAGLEEDGTAYLCGMDTIGAMVSYDATGAPERGCRDAPWYAGCLN